MARSVQYKDIVEKARSGDRESLEKLTKEVRPILRAYVYRITLKDDLTQDVVQETLIEMFKILGKLEKTEKFWPWLRGIAYNKLRRHYQTEKRRRVVQMPDDGEGGGGVMANSADSHSGLTNLVGQELRQIVFSAMNQLKPHYRAVLTMRCYEDMEYSQIAKLMDCTELSVRVQFYRAKKSLHRQLSSNGFSKGALLSALVLFGRMTAPSEAAANISISSSALKVGAVAVLTATAAQTAVVTAVVGGAIVAAVVVNSPAVVESNATKIDKAAASLQTSVLPGKPEIGNCWYYFPEKTNGPVMIRCAEGAGEDLASSVHFLQNAYGNYRYDSLSNRIFVNSHHRWNADLSVMRLPTDSPQLTNFLASVDGYKPQTQFVNDNGFGLLVMSQNKLAVNDQNRVIRHINVLEEEYFSYNWPAAARRIDNRDDLHKQGWCYFQITGSLVGKAISGKGRIPLIYDAFKDHSPVMTIRLASDVGEAFYGAAAFKGLIRPWAGLHVVDTIRRDAAEQFLFFETDINADRTVGRVRIAHDGGSIVYTVDMEKDLIDKIELISNKSQASSGVLNFTYTTQDGQFVRELNRLRASGYRHSRRRPEGMLWLVKLAEGTL